MVVRVKIAAGTYTVRIWHIGEVFEGLEIVLYRRRKGSRENGGAFINCEKQLALMRRKTCPRVGEMYFFI